MSAEFKTSHFFCLHPYHLFVFKITLILVESLPATLPKYTVSFLKELANHGCRFAVGQIMGVSTVLSFFAKTMHEVSENT